MGKDKIFEDLSNNITVEKFKKIDKRNTVIKNWVQKTLTLMVCCLSITGMVFAKNISNAIYDNLWASGNGSRKAINSGYVEKTEMTPEQSLTTATYEETGDVIEDFESSIKVDEFVMDDYTLDITFDINLIDKISRDVIVGEYWNMEFPDLLIYDENNVVVFFSDIVKLNEFCKENNLGYDYDSAPEGMIIGSGYSYRIIEKDENNIKIAYNIYTGGNNKYPKSKKLYVDIGKIKIKHKPDLPESNEEKNIILKGNWQFSVDVPEKMYNRSNVTYVQKSTTNKEINVKSAICYDTGTDIEIQLKAIDEVKSPSIPELDFFNSLPEGDELKSIDILNYISNKLYKTEEYKEYMEKSFKRWNVERYLVNERGERFNMSSSNRENGGGSIDENNIYTAFGTFDLTKYDMTDTITLYVDYNGQKAEIVLEKVDE